MTWKTGLDGKIRDDRGRITSWVPQPGRKYLNTKTGEIITRRQFDKLSGRVVGSNEQKAKRNKADDELAQIMRPARGRTKAKSVEEAQERLEVKKKKLKSIRPQLLKTGHRAERIPFYSYEDYIFLLQEARNKKLSNGRRLITSYSWGIDGVDDRNGKRITAILSNGMSSPSVVLSEDEFNEAFFEFVETHIYYLHKNFFMHLHFDREYAESRMSKAQIKRARSRYGKK